MRIETFSVPVVAIIGRPNVGKSALFNRLLMRRKALVDATPGLTRDRLYGDVNWRGLDFRIVDTGGLQFDTQSRLGQAIQAQVVKAMEEATLALFVLDAKAGPVPLDHEVAVWIRRWGKPVLPVVNKVDSEKDLSAAYEFSSLSFGTPLGISSLHGLGIGELLDSVVGTLQKGTHLNAGLSPKGASPFLRVAIVGRPNVGKSSLVNRLLNEERVLVDEAPGTTRDPVETWLTFEGRSVCLIDTAGIRSKRRLKMRIDAVARLKAMESIERADGILGVVEAPVGILRDDLKLLSEAIHLGRPMCLAVNKWDLIPNPPDAKTVASEIGRRAPFLKFAPVVLTSAKTGLNVLKALTLSLKAATQARRRLTSAEEKQLLQAIRSDLHAPASIRNARLFRLYQVSICPPTFHLMVRVRRGPRIKPSFQDSDLAYLENRIRSRIGFSGTPIRIRLLGAT